MTNTMTSDLLKSNVIARYGRFNDDGISSHTSREQIKVELSVLNCLKNANQFSDHGDDSQLFKLLRDEHIQYLEGGLFDKLNVGFESLDCSRPWLVYWITHSLSILGARQFLRSNDYKIVAFLKHCESPTEGGYCGGPGQEAHIAATYAAVNALVTIGGNVAFSSIDLQSVRKFLCLMQHHDGSFTLHSSGEIDIRGAYCALSIAKLLNIPIFSDAACKDDLFSKTADWVLSCQTYEGGFGAAPGHEAHGGYTFCGVACLVMLEQLHRCDMESLLRWITNKQLKFEGGFCGRTNKLVDGCYSFWNGAIIPIIQTWMASKENKTFDRWMINQEALQEYLLACCQDKRGGLIDKPGKPRDFYHTCYTLSGLSIAQYSMNFDNQAIVGSPEDNLVEPIHPIFNITIDAIKESKEYFFQKTH